jgi:hypothetical protein
LAGIPTHRPFLKRIVIEPYLYDLLLALAALVSVGYACHRAAENEEGNWAIGLAAAGVLICLVAVGKVCATAHKQGIQESRHELEGCLHTLHAVLTTGTTDKHGLRVTVHVPLQNGAKLQQVLEYVGDPRGRHRGKTVGRTWASNWGIIGKVLTSGEEDCIVAKRESENYEQYISDLQSVWHFTEEQARRVDPAAMSWMAIRLKDSQGQVQGIVYCDSTQPEFFTAERRDMAIAACAGIARYVARRYK